VSTPNVTEITRRLEPVAHDTFIDDLRAVAEPRDPRLRDPSRSARPRE
jgi:hypothetical protein